MKSEVMTKILVGKIEIIIKSKVTLNVNNLVDSLVSRPLMTPKPPLQQRQQTVGHTCAFEHIKNLSEKFGIQILNGHFCD